MLWHRAHAWKKENRLWFPALFVIAGTWALLYIIFLIIFVGINSPPELPAISEFLLLLGLIGGSGVPFILFFLLPARHLLIRIIFAVALVLYTALNICLAYFQASRGIPFDFYYFWYNRHDSLATITSVYPYAALVFFSMVVVCVVVIASFTVLYQIRANKNQASLQAKTILRIVLALLVLVIAPSPLKKLINDMRTHVAVSQFTAYEEAYKSAQPLRQPAVVKTEAGRPSFILVELESLNSEFVTPRITPVLTGLAEKGIVFTRHHSNGILSARALDVIWCGMLPSLDVRTLFDAVSHPDATKLANPKSLFCLPRVLHNAGYRTYLFNDYDLSFENMGALGSDLGFDEVHGPDLMRSDDPKLQWGYREDVFFQRVSQYLQQHTPDSPVYVHIIVGATNHIPFQIQDASVRQDLMASLPYPAQSNYRERRADTAYLQDGYLKSFFDNFTRLPFFSQSHLFIFGDHPIAFSRTHPEFSYNIEGVEEDHFLTTLAFVPAPSSTENFARGLITSDVGTDHRGVAASVYDLADVPAPDGIGSSFVPLLQGKPVDRCAVNAQPYVSPAISLVEYPYKIVFDVLKGQIKQTDLSQAQLGLPEHYQIIERSLANAGQYLAACSTGDLSKFLSR